MNFHAVLHIPESSYACPADSRHLELRLRTARGDCAWAAVILSQKHRWKERQRFPMEKVASDRLFDYYQYTLETDDARLGYYFELNDGEKTACYSESGFSDEFDHAKAHGHHFQFPYLHSCDALQEPEWAADAVFYQIFVERFATGEPARSPKGLTPWGERPGPHSFYGGDLQGIADHLDYLEKLGINGIYLTPVFKSPSNHKYDTADYREIDPYFGDAETLRRLVEQAHRRGIRVLLDCVFNHCGIDFEPFQDLLHHGESSRYRSWFHPLSLPLTQKPPNYRTFQDGARMPKLNTADPECKSYLLETIEYWMRETGIDGWRLDVSDEIDHRFWRDFRDRVKLINPEAFILGENWHNARVWLTGDQFDSSMNYPVNKTCVQFFADQEIGPGEFVDDLSAELMWNSDPVNLVLFNQLDSHDTPRFLTLCGGSRERLRLAALFLFSYPGIPCLYYGTEIGMEGGNDPDCRRAFDWDVSHWDSGLWEYFQKLIRLRRKHTALRRGTVRLAAPEGVVRVERQGGGETIVTLLNRSEQPVCAALGWAARELLTGAQTPDGRVELPPWGGGLFLRGPCAR